MWWPTCMYIFFLNSPCNPNTHKIFWKSADQNTCICLFYQKRLSSFHIAAITAQSINQMKHRFSQGETNLLLYFVTQWQHNNMLTTQIVKFCWAINVFINQLPAPWPDLAKKCGDRLTVLLYYQDGHNTLRSHNRGSCLCFIPNKYPAYFSKVRVLSHMIVLCKFKTLNHTLTVETGRWTRPHFL